MMVDLLKSQILDEVLAAASVSVLSYQEVIDHTFKRIFEERIACCVCADIIPEDDKRFILSTHSFCADTLARSLERHVRMIEFEAIVDRMNNLRSIAGEDCDHAGNYIDALEFTAAMDGISVEDARRKYIR